MSDKKSVYRDSLKKLLETTSLVVTFTKADGSERDMVCTLQPSLLPEVVNESKEDKPKRKLSDDVLRVYDLEKEGWRSFRLDSVKNFRLA